MADNLFDSTDDSPPSFANLPSKFTRREIAKNEIEQAILLWFDARICDLPSVHTLAVAAQGVMDAVCRDKKVERSKLLAGIEEHGWRFTMVIRNFQNFFKHGAHDRNLRGKRDKDVIEFPYEMTAAILSDNIEVYHRLFGGVSALMVCFSLWFECEHAVIESFKRTKIKLLKRLGLSRTPRKPEFIRLVLPIVGEFADDVSLPHIKVAVRPTKGGLEKP
jgi:hypothetical protein